MPVKIFLSNLIMSQNSKELLRKSAKQVLTARSDPSKPVVNTATILNTIKERRKNLPRTAKSSLPVIIPDPQKNEYVDQKYTTNKMYKNYFLFYRTKEGAKQVLEMLISGPKSFVSHNFKPEMMRLVPPLYFCKEEVLNNKPRFIF